MKKLDSLDDVTALFRDEPRPAVEDADRAAARRARVVPVIERLIVAEAADVKRRARRRRTGIGIAAFACAASVALAVGWPRGETVSSDVTANGSGTAAPAPGPALPTPPGSIAARMVSAAPGASIFLPEGGAVEARPGSELLAEARLTTALDEARVVTVSSVSLRIGADSAVRFIGGERTEERVMLDRGHIDAEVPPGDRSRRFIVATLDAEVVVHGTRFGVTAAPGAGTQVDVTEGVVSVRARGSEVTLTAGSHWSSVGGVSPPGSSARDGKPVVTAPSVAAPSSGSVPAPSSDLAAQNALYGEAMAAKRRGDQRAVVARLDELLARWPESPLAPEAKAERASAAGRILAPP